MNLFFNGIPIPEPYHSILVFVIICFLAKGMADTYYDWKHWFERRRIVANHKYFSRFINEQNDTLEPQEKMGINAVAIEQQYKSQANAAKAKCLATSRAT